MKTKALMHKLHTLVEFEEHVGKAWHRLVTSSASKRYPQAAVNLKQMNRRLSIFFRAMGGNAAMKVGVSQATENAAQRNWLQRLAGSEQKIEMGWYDQEALYLPAKIDLFDSVKLNQDCYFWLTALAALQKTTGAENNHDKSWLEKNKQACLQVLKTWPGLSTRYDALVEAQIQIRPAINTLTDEQAELEIRIRQALREPANNQNENIDIDAQIIAEKKLPPVYLWLNPLPTQAKTIHSKEEDITQQAAGGETVVPEEQRHYKAEEVDMPDGNKGLVLDRFENIFSWAEYIKVDRSTDEDEDLASAEDAANDLDQLSIARDTKATVKRIRFDLDLPSAEQDDQPLGQGILLDEWDYRKQILIENHCCLQPMIAADAPPQELPQKLRAAARRVRHQFEALQPQRIWHKGQQEGSELDLNAWLDFSVDRLQGHGHNDTGMFKDFRGGVRDLDCLLLADLSLSTDAAVNGDARVIDVIRDSLMLFSEALSATGDGFAMYGFSSRYRDHVRFHQLKSFDESYNEQSRGRIAAIKPGFYTRMGAAIRHASSLLKTRRAQQRILLLLTDGKPNDLDLYEGRYGIEDTRMAIIEARRQGLLPFCVTIDPEAGSYLPYMFGNDAYVQIKKPQELPRELPLLYARLTS
ncbi:Nitric oxide reductase activation protein NorD [hydrothermal vent metagenome]|uniref:Nitric oxide reductase activation protein NorD n=1 Tax=hydrothermal vent metagenome TaxID=652676 RepID=A0A3B0XU85_9ZZZZ